MLDEFQYAIRHFVPTVPAAVKEEAQALHDRFAADKTVDEATLSQAFYRIGRKEYPHRHAYEELTHTSAEALMKQMVLEHVDGTVRGVIKPHLDAGVSLEEIVASDLFESQLDAKQRYQVEDGILVSQSKLADKLKGHVGEQSSNYDKLVTTWEAHALLIEKAIGELEALAQGGDDPPSRERGDEDQQAQMKSKVARFREGFLVTEPDPDLEVIKKEIEYWKEILASE